MRGERGRGGDECRADQHQPHEGKPSPNSERNGSCYACFTGVATELLGQNADSTPFRGDLLCNRNLRDMTATKPGAWS